MVVTDLVEKKVKKVVKKETIERKVWKLKEDDARARFKGRVGELVSADAPYLWKCFKERMLKVCDEVYGKKKERSRGHMVVEREREGSDSEKEGWA